MYTDEDWHRRLRHLDWQYHGATGSAAAYYRQLKADIENAFYAWKAALLMPPIESAGAGALLLHKSWGGNSVVETKSAPGSRGLVTIQASSFGGEPDYSGDVIMHGAWDGLDEWIASGGPIHAQHDDTVPAIANAVSAKQDHSGLFVTAEWASSPDGRAWKTIVEERIRASKPVPASVAVRVDRSEPMLYNGKQARLITSCRLKEVSIVGAAANVRARALGFCG